MEPTTAPRSTAGRGPRAVGLLAWLPILLLASALGGCASKQGGGLVDKALEMVGLKKDDIPVDALPPVTPQPKKLLLRVHAGEQLNIDPAKRSLSVVVRVYKLRGANAFLAAPYQGFASPEAEKRAFGGELIEAREIVLTPGQRHEVVETMPPEATHLAVATLFRAPAERRWRFAFRVKDSEKSGVTVGVHGCAMSVAAGVPEDAAPEMLRLAGVNCQ
jgi:type VI secretion system protein VasD